MDVDHGATEIEETRSGDGRRRGSSNLRLASLCPQHRSRTDTWFVSGIVGFVGILCCVGLIFALRDVQRRTAVPSPVRTAEVKTLPASLTISTEPSTAAMMRPSVDYLIVADETLQNTDTFLDQINTPEIRPRLNRRRSEASRSGSPPIDRKLAKATSPVESRVAKTSSSVRVPEPISTATEPDFLSDVDARPQFAEQQLTVESSNLAPVSAAVVRSANSPTAQVLNVEQDWPKIPKANFKLVNHIDVVVKDVIEEERLRFPQLAELLSRYDTALDRVWEEPKNRSAAQGYYTSLAELCAFVHRHDVLPDEVRDVFLEIRENRALFGLVSSSGHSWIGWKGRKTEGITIAGTLEAVGDSSLQIRIRDARSSLVEVRVPVRKGMRLGDELVVIGRVQGRNGRYFLSGIVPGEYGR